MLNLPQARRRLSAPKVKAFNNSISVDWADLMEEPSADVMAKVSNLSIGSAYSLKIGKKKNLSAFKARHPEYVCYITCISRSNFFYLSA